MTGGIACGKSVVARVFENKGFYVHSADQAARDLVAPGRPAWRKIVRRFGPAILRPDRTIDRARLGAVIFSDPEARRFLDSLLHPLVLGERTKVWREVERRGRHAIFVSEAALTIEAGYARHFDRIIVVRCDDDVRLRRLMERDGIGREEALRKIGSQMPQAEKVRHADYVIDASGSYAETVEAAERTAALLLQDAALKRMRTGRPGYRTRGPSAPGRAGT